MKQTEWERFARGSRALGADVRVRLARPSDQVFLSEMAEIAGSNTDVEKYTRPHFQSGIRSALKSRGGYYQKIVDVHNTAVMRSSSEHPVLAAVDAASFSIIAYRGKENLGALSVGASCAVVSHLLVNLDEHQALSLVMGLPKLTSLAVSPELRGQGIGAQVLDFMSELLPQMGCVGTFGETHDSPNLVAFYETHGYHVLPVGVPLNTWPIAGRHIVKRPTPEGQGPFIQAEPGMRMMFKLAGNNTETENKMLELNQ